jgi:glutaredoxin-related protein
MIELRNTSTVFEELEVLIVDLMFVCFQTSVYTLGEFHKNRNNSTVFDELEVSIVALTHQIHNH